LKDDLNYEIYLKSL